MTLELLCDVGRDARDFGLLAGTHHEIYQGFGDECGTVNPDGTPNGNVWIRCPKAPPKSVWKRPYILLCPSDFQLLET